MNSYPLLEPDPPPTAICRECKQPVAWQGYAPLGSTFSHGECLRKSAAKENAPSQQIGA